MPRLFTLALTALFAVTAATQVSAEICGTNKSGQAIACPGGTCCPSSKTGSWTCAPLGSTCCYGTNKADGEGLYCAYGSMCYDSENCADDKMSTFPATPGSSGQATATTLSADRTVYDGRPMPTTTVAGAGGATGTGTGTGTDKPAGVTGAGTAAPGGTETGKPNGARGGYAGMGGSRDALAAACFSAFWAGITLV